MMMSFLPRWKPELYLPPSEVNIMLTGPPSSPRPVNGDSGIQRAMAWFTLPMSFEASGTSQMPMALMDGWVGRNDKTDHMSTVQHLAGFTYCGGRTLQSLGLQACRLCR